ncbi:Uncharacterised protein [Mycobacterium tuberculosis]|nr:Uncharacterised protein [Mycobacterium tuberculosis]
MDLGKSFQPLRLLGVLCLIRADDFDRHVTELGKLADHDRIELGLGGRRTTYNRDVVESVARQPIGRKRSQVRAMKFVR